MLTALLKSQFEELACQDHFKRIHALLFELDHRKLYCQQPDFKERLLTEVQRLGAFGICTAYQQGCALLSIFAGGVSPDSVCPAKNPQETLLAWIRRALQEGVPRSAYSHLHCELAKMGSFDEAWLGNDMEPNFLDLLSVDSLIVRIEQVPEYLNSKPSSSADLSEIFIPCVRKGPICSLDFDPVFNQPCLFRTQSDFQLKVIDRSSFISAIEEVCKNLLPEDVSLISPKAEIQSCELALSSPQGFLGVQKFQLVDARRLEFNVNHRPFFLDPDRRAFLKAASQKQGRFEALDISSSQVFFTADVSFSANWLKTCTGFDFQTQGQTRLRLSPAALEWEFNFLLHAVPVQLHIQTPNAVQIEWSMQSAWPSGLLPIGKPLLNLESRVPLIASIQSIVQVGKPVVNLSNAVVGFLDLRLTATIDPQTRQLQLVLLVSHSELNFHWQLVEPLVGWSQGVIELAPPQPVQEWDLLHG